MDNRIGWDAYFMSIAKAVSVRSSCIKRQVGAVIVIDNRIVSTGYNGTPRGLVNCNDGGCPRCSSLIASGEKLDECLCSHAEENAIVQAASHGVSIKGGVLYTTFSPCLMCAKMIINADLSRVLYGEEYPCDKGAKSLLSSSKVRHWLAEKLPLVPHSTHINIFDVNKPDLLLL